MSICEQLVGIQLLFLTTWIHNPFRLFRSVVTLQYLLPTLSRERVHPLEGMESCQEGKIGDSFRLRNLLCSRCGNEFRYSMLSLDYYYSLRYSLSPNNSPDSDVQHCNDTPNL